MNLQPPDSTHSLHSVKFGPHLKDTSTVVFFLFFFFIDVKLRGGRRYLKEEEESNERGTRVEDVGVNAGRDRRQN